ncbi:MAG: T9SS type A sorting domain-containing protein [Bacteroidales bacterium]|nr:T9SS type A sorting domain-containing protein [Bacteroidales bacterium]
MRNLLVIVCVLLAVSVSAQGLSNPLAMHKDSSAFVGWATSAEIVRGYVKISDTTFTYTDNALGITSNHAFYGTIDNCLGKANGQYISLGDGGYITLQFDSPIVNGVGHDFAVFENALIPNAVPNQDSIVFYELAFVEVSSNGVDFVRFPAVSHVQTDEQVGPFGYENSNLLTNLAGVFPVFYGYPFDLEELANEPNLDVNNITHVRLIDVVGSIDPQYGTYDSEGNIINDPYPTPFHSCGFDLDAVGVIHSLNSVQENISVDANAYPNPASDFVNLSADRDFSVEIYNVMGQKVLCSSEKSTFFAMDISGFKSGIYFVAFVFDDCRTVKKIEVMQ